MPLPLAHVSVSGIVQRTIGVNCPLYLYQLKILIRLVLMLMQHRLVFVVSGGGDDVHCH